MTLVANLQNSARVYPARCAIQEGEVCVSYADLLRAATAIASTLVRQGIKPGDRVALVLNNSSEFAAAYYGVMMMGGIAVLLNAAAKRRDIEVWLQHCEAAATLTEPTHREAHEAASACGVGRLFVTTGDIAQPFGFATSDQTPDFPEPGLNGPACIIYTSGTTGEPKGVVLTHGNLAANNRAIVEYLQLSADDSIVSVLPFYYSYGSSVLHTHLLVGGRVILEKNLVYPHVVVETLARTRATGFAGVPSTFALLLSRVALGNYDLSGVRYLTQAGGGMAPALTQRLRQAMPAARLFVMYGQTEATARISYLPPEELEQKLGSVGVPVPGVEVSIRDESGSAVDRGVTGEVWVRGPNVMQGYWRNDAATSRVKVDGWLRTGDLGSLDADGFIYLVGRRSDMIKSGAHRIQPQDIEDVITELPSVQEAAVVGVDDELLGQAIKAFVVTVDGASVSPLQIQAHCRQRLANYKVPKSVEIVPNLPRTATGKVRRSELIERTKRD